MINAFLIAFAIVVLASLMLGMIRVMIGPTNIDRMLSAQIISTAGVGFLLLLSFGLGATALLDVALVLALLAAIAAISFCRRFGPVNQGGLK